MTTTSTAVELVQSLYEAFGRGDIPFVLAHVAEDCQWTSPGQDIPAAGAYVGPAGAGEFFQKLGASEEFTRFEPKEYFVKGDDVVALGFEECRSRATSKTMSTNWAMLFRVRDGKVVYWEAFYDTSAYAKAHRG